jgi:hypothetical protein
MEESSFKEETLPDKSDRTTFIEHSPNEIPYLVPE